MEFPFSLVSDLLERVYAATTSTSSTVNRKHLVRDVITKWFDLHRQRIDACDAAALMATLLPEKRPDRVYNIRAPRLEQIVGRSLCLGHSRLPQLRRHQVPGAGLDLGDCVELILRETPNPAQDERHRVTVEAIDRILHGIASTVRWSSPAIRQSRGRGRGRGRGTQRASSAPCSEIQGLENLYRRVTPREAKWLTRVILKDFRPVELDPGLILGSCNSLLPPLLKVQEDLEVALSLLKEVKACKPAVAKSQLLQVVKPKLGVKVARQPWMKGRSIKHCLQMGYGRMSVEEKIDGEYCQVHVDLSKGKQCIQIFSKSGKDSTEDRSDLFGAIRDALEIGLPTCKIRKGCILEGELVIYSDKEQAILPFHKIRKYVARRGQFLGAEMDSQKRDYEHVMIIFYDVLLVDDLSLLPLCKSRRFEHLQSLIKRTTGHAELVRSQVIDFNRPSAASYLRKAFAATIQAREEGLVLKPDDPYFHFGERDRDFKSCCIKLKKEYIFGDDADFAVVAARYDSDEAKKHQIPGLKFTHVYVGCMTNREEVCKQGAAPNFTVVNVVAPNTAQLKSLMREGCLSLVPVQENSSMKFRVSQGVSQGKDATMVFTTPLVLEIRFFNFDRVGNTGFWSPRFPSIARIHFDRTHLDAMTFDELQAMAVDSTGPGVADSQEMLYWMEELKAADPGGIPADALSQLTSTTAVTPSPSPSTQSRIPPPGPVATRSPISRRAPSTRPQTLPNLPLPTPPTSSIPEQRQRHAKDGEGILGKRPRAGESDSSPRKHPTPSHESTKAACSESASATRRPLGEVAPNSQSQEDPLSVSVQELQSSQELNGGASKNIVEDDENAEAPNRPPLPSGVRQPPLAGSTRIPNSTGISGRQCRFVAPGSQCCFSKFSVLLFPQVSASSHPVWPLLEAHGVEPVLDAEEWKSDTAGPVARKQTGLGAFKICLVDSSDRAGTVEQAKAIKSLGLKDPGGHRDITTLYDWKVLELMGRVEDPTCTKKQKGGWSDPWRRWFVGVA